MSTAPFDIMATAIDDKYITFACPFCPRRRGNNPVMHSHSSDGDRTPRVEHRFEHCRAGVFPQDRYCGFNIHVTAATVGARVSQGSK